MLPHEEHLTYAEIAIVQGKREGAVKKEMSRLLRQLADLPRIRPLRPLA